MNLYRLKTSKKFVGTKADAKQSGEEWEPYDFPINPKADTIAALNRLVDEAQTQEAPQPAEPQTPEVTDDASYAERMVTQTADGKQTVEEAVELIMTCSSITLGRLSKAVAIRFGELAKRKKK